MTQSKETGLKGKAPRESRTEQVQILSQGSLNGCKRLFGGKLMEWIDVVAAVTARRHSGKNVTTAAVDSLEFKAAAYANDTVVLVGTVTYTGNTSMEICVKTFVESLDGTRQLINKAFVIMVALDADERPTRVPPLLPETDEEKAEWEEGKERSAARKARRRTDSPE